jgi:hypothetical protein
MMNTIEIDDKLKKYKCYVGTFARNQLPKRLNKNPAALVINSDADNQPGEHWTATFFKDSTCYYFDSFGFPPLHPDIRRFTDKHSCRLLYNTRQLQNVSATTCGMYCVVFVAMICKGMSFVDFIQMFSKSTSDNDQIIRIYESLI